MRLVRNQAISDLSNENVVTLAPLLQEAANKALQAAGHKPFLKAKYAKPKDNPVPLVAVQYNAPWWECWANDPEKDDEVEEIVAKALGAFTHADIH